MKVADDGTLTLPAEVVRNAKLSPGDDVEVRAGERQVQVVAPSRKFDPQRFEEAVARYRANPIFRRSADDIMRELRPWHEEPPGVLD